MTGFLIKISEQNRSFDKPYSYAVGLYYGYGSVYFDSYSYHVTGGRKHGNESNTIWNCSYY